jgi:hypothetical protein
MAKRHLPSVEALTSSDDDLLRVELRLSQVRAEVERARSLLEELDAAPGRERSDLAGILARLGCHIVEMATALK